MSAISTPGQLVLTNGAIFDGELIGAKAPITAGEVVFNTVLSGYQEVITDRSYAGQIITFTYPHIGNCGVNATDFESIGPVCRGVIVRDLSRRYSNHRAEGSLDALLFERGVSGIAGVDTRRLTRIIRNTGAVAGAFGSAPTDEMRAAADAEPGTTGVDLVGAVTTPQAYVVEGVGPRPQHNIVAIDFGMKKNIAVNLARIGRVEVVPATTSAADILARQPDGVFLSNGPGDPAMVVVGIQTIRDLLGEVPVFGICLGHQLLGRAIGADTIKLPFGHHGGNHPVKNLQTGMVEITSQNHNFAIASDTLPDAVQMTHINLNDDVCEGIAIPAERAFGVQHHPEANPGPHDAAYLFNDFDRLMTESQ